MIVDGRKMAEEVLARARARAEKLHRRPIVLWYVASEPTPATRSYLKIKERSAEAAGCDFVETKNPTFLSTADAGIIQLPMPAGLEHLLSVIPLGKDADVLSASAREKFERGDTDALLPPVAGAVCEIFSQNGINPKGKKAVVIGKGFLVGAPVATWLTQQGADVYVIDNPSDFAGARAVLAHADIIVSGAGSPHFIKPEMIKDGVVLIDAGTSESGGALAGDADPSCAEKCSFFTPVPGGVGPLAVACLFANAVTLAERAMNI